MKFHEKMLITEEVIRKHKRGGFFLHTLYIKPTQGPMNHNSITRLHKYQNVNIFRFIFFFISQIGLENILRI